MTQGKCVENWVSMRVPGPDRKQQEASENCSDRKLIFKFKRNNQVHKKTRWGKNTLARKGTMKMYANIQAKNSKQENT